MICKEQGRARGPPSEKIVSILRKTWYTRGKISRAERRAVRMDDGILLFHGSKEEVIYPEIRITRYTKDFSWGFTVPRVISRRTAGQTGALPTAS